MRFADLCRVLDSATVKVRGRVLGAGREADVYAVGDDAVLKLYHPSFDGHRSEVVTLRALEGRGVAPKLLEVADYDGRTGLVLQRIAGLDTLTLVQRQPWRVHAIARSLAVTHLAIHAVKAPAELPDLREALTGRIRDSGLPPRLLDFAARVLDGLPDGDRLCHGDYHPGNVLLAGSRTAVIDWGAATRGAAEADHARTLLLLRWADPLPGTSLASRALIATGRALLTAAYARAYQRGSAPLHDTRSWLVVHTAARLSEGIAIERDMLIDRLERALRDTR